MSDIERKAFEHRFPVPMGVYWSERAKDYTYESLPFIGACCSYSRMWKTWQAARQAPASGEVEPFAWVSEAEETEQLIGGRPRKLWWECKPGAGTPIHTHPPAKVPEGITVKMLDAIWQAGIDAENYDDRDFCDPLIRARIAIEESTPTPATTPQPEGDGCGGDPSNGCAHCEPEHGCQANQRNVPAGWKLVPIESASEMDIAVMDRMCDNDKGYVIDRDTAETIWSVMVSAAPTPPQEQ